MDLTRRTHELIDQHFLGRNKNLAVDATCGNGFDSEFLATLGFKEIIAFDIQKRALRNTEQRLTAAGYFNVQLINDGHQHFTQYLTRPADCVMFNFGYLPNLENSVDTDKSITTCADTSLRALKAALNNLAVGGFITLICYPGHPQGAEETARIKAWLDDLCELYEVQTYLATSPKPTAPLLFTIKASTT